MEASRLLEIQRLEDREHERTRKLVAQKEVLQSQITERKEERDKLVEETMRDRAMVDDVLEKIRREDEAERDAHRRKVEETRESVARYQEEVRARREAAEGQRRREEAEARAYNAMVEERYLREEEERKRAEDEKKSRFDKVVEETRNQTQSREEFEQLRDLLWEEEREAKQKRASLDGRACRFAVVCLIHTCPLTHCTGRDREGTATRRPEAADPQGQHGADRGQEDDARRDRTRGEGARGQDAREVRAGREGGTRAGAEQTGSSFAVVCLTHTCPLKHSLVQRFQQRFATEAYKEKVAQEEARRLEKKREVEEERALLDQENGNRDLIEEAKRVLLAKHAAELEGFLR